MRKVLIIDDDKIVGITLAQIFERENFEVKIAHSGNEGIAATIEFLPDIVLLDFKLPDMDGFQVLKKIKDYDKNIDVVMITSYGEIPRAVKAIKMGATDFFTKPFDKAEIMRLVKSTQKKQRDVVSDSNDIQRMMGNSEPLQHVLDKINRIHSHDINVFLEGETGTGKELFARMIHAKSPRRNKPFIAVDCGAIPDNLFESELFGHTKGAFTGAISDKKGKFELADGGTIFLDEINSLPTNLQPKFLRVIQENEIQRLGAEKTTKINVRIIAASNNDIYNDVKNGSFREDLFYRIHEFKIDLPTLKQRRDDIMVIAIYFLKEFSREYQKEVTGFSKDAINALTDYAWPGNIRELKNAIRSAVILTDSNIITKEHLILKNIRKNSEERQAENPVYDNFVSKTEDEIICKTLEKAKYNKTKAAKLLGISRSYLYKKLKNIDLE
jgi:DNA-binding NtrC family response regulator